MSGAHQIVGRLQEITEYCKPANEHKVNAYPRNAEKTEVGL